MKKNGKGLTRVTAVLATALMAVSAVSMTVSASEAKQTETRTTITSVKNNVSKAAAISLVGGNAKPGDIVEVPIIMKTGNQCTCYDVLIEYDSRLEFDSVSGAQATCDFEENGRKYISIVGYDVKPYEDGVAAATIKLRVPDGAENDDYHVRFSQITNFSTDQADFEEYKTNNTVIKVTGGVEKLDTNSIKLLNTTGMVGDSAVVQLVPFTGNKCAAYDILVEYDSRLLIESKDIAGANAHCIFEKDGKSYVSLVGYTADIFADNKAMAALNFHLPSDADASDTFEVNIASVTDFSSSYASFENYETHNALISVCKTSRSNEKYQEYKVFKSYSEGGALMGSAVGFRGDSNGDNKADVRDAAATANFCATKNGVNEMGQFFGDVDDSGKLDVRDAAKIARYVAMGKTSWDKVNCK